MWKSSEYLAPTVIRTLNRRARRFEIYTLHVGYYILCRQTNDELGPELFPALIRRCDDLPATITHVPVAAVLVLNTPDDGRLRPKHVE